MLTARVDIIGHTSDTVDIQVIVFPTESTDPQIGAVDVVDNSSPPLSLLGSPEQIPVLQECLITIRYYGDESSKDMDMAPLFDRQAAIIRTERGLTIAGTRITLYDVMDRSNNSNAADG